MPCRMCSYDAHSQCDDLECTCAFPLHIHRPDHPRPASLGPAPVPTPRRPAPPPVPVAEPVPAPVTAAVAVLDKPPPPPPPPPAPAPVTTPEPGRARRRRPSTSARRRRRPPAPIVELAPPPVFAPVAGSGTVHVTLARPGPRITQPSWTIPPPKPTYRADQDPARRIRAGQIHWKLKAAREQRQQWEALVAAADRLLATNRWNPASKQLVAEVLAGWLDPRP
jgi:hypothetical protein